MPEITEPLTDEELRETAENGWAPHAARLATELLAARAEMAALRNDLDAKRSDFDAAMDHLGKAEFRVRELEAFVVDVACHGLRTDLTPTFMVTGPDEYAAATLRYLRSADENLRADARKFVPDADRPRNAGRPIPAPRVEVVAECVTELDLLRAQDGVQ